MWLRVALLAVAFGAGWAVNGWRLGEDAAELAQAQAEQQREQWREVARETSRLRAQAATLQASLTSIAAEGRKAVEIAQNETNRLQRCIDRGDCGLRVRVAVPTACPGAVPGAPNGGPVDSGAGAALAADARPDYFALRAAIAVTEGKLSACQKALRAVTAAPATQVSPRP